MGHKLKGLIQLFISLCKEGEEGYYPHLFTCTQTTRFFLTFAKVEVKAFLFVCLVSGYGESGF